MSKKGLYYYELICVAILVGYFQLILVKSFLFNQGNDVLVGGIAHMRLAAENPQILPVEMPYHGPGVVITHIELMQRYIALFGRGSIDCLLADREFVGKHWLDYLNFNHIQYHIRIRENFWVTLPMNGPVVKAAWLISAAIDLSEAADTKLNFEEAINYGTGNIDTEQEVMVSTDYSGSGDPSAASWTKLTVTGRASGDSWDFVSVDEVDLSDFDGFSSLYIAFKYTSTVDGAATWEVDNVVVTAESTIGIEENQNISNAVKVYPNPSEGMINISSNVIDKAEYKAFSITGEVVSHGVIEGNQSSINLSDMTNGIYTLQITENDKTAVKRIIIR